MKKVLFLSLVLGLGSIVADDATKVYFYDVEIPEEWTTESPLKPDTNRNHKVRLMEVLSSASMRADKKNAKKLFDTLKKMISGGTVSKTKLMANTALFSADAEMQAKELSLEFYHKMLHLGRLNKQDAEKWKRSLDYKCNRVWPPSVNKAIRYSTEWMNA